MLSPDEILEALNIPFRFVRRPVPIPADLRASWKIALVVAILDRCCRGGRSSLRRLHVLNWAIRSPRNLKAVHGALQGAVDPTTVLVRFDPSLNRAIDRARGFGLVRSPRGDRVELTPMGEALVRQMAVSETLSTESEALSEIGQQLTEARTDELLRWYAQ